ncbi:MAG: GntR family transcriptional regulator [Pseudomonadota bacterium]
MSARSRGALAAARKAFPPASGHAEGVGRDDHRPDSAPKNSRTRKPKYVAIRDWLTDRILGGHFARGEQLPSEHELMEKFSVSRVTARQAFNSLREFGLVESRRGKGYFVRQLTAVHQLERLEGFGELMAPLGVPTRSDVIELLEIPATDKEVADALRLQSGELVTRIARLRIAGGIAMSLDISYFPISIGQRLAQLDLARSDVFTLLENRLDIELGFADLKIDVVPADKRHASYLGVRTGTPVIRTRRLTHDINGAPVDFEYLYSRVESLSFNARTVRH